MTTACNVILEAFVSVIIPLNEPLEFAAVGHVAALEPGAGTKPLERTMPRHDNSILPSHAAMSSYNASRQMVSAGAITGGRAGLWGG